MPTTRRARAAQSEDSQSPLRMLELQPKSRKKVSRTPKTLNKKVSDDKVIKKHKATSKSGGRRATKKTTQEAGDHDDTIAEEMEDVDTEPTGVQDTQAHTHESGDSDMTEGEATEAEQSEVDMTDVENTDAEAMEAQLSEHSAHSELAAQSIHSEYSDHSAHAANPEQSPQSPHSPHPGQVDDMEEDDDEPSEHSAYSADEEASEGAAGTDEDEEDTVTVVVQQSTEVLHPATEEPGQLEENSPDHDTDDLPQYTEPSLVTTRANIESTQTVIDDIDDDDDTAVIVQESIRVSQPLADEAEAELEHADEKASPEHNTERQSLYAESSALDANVLARSSSQHEQSDNELDLGSENQTPAKVMYDKQSQTDNNAAPHLDQPELYRVPAHASTDATKPDSVALGVEESSDGLSSCLDPGSELKVGDDARHFIARRALINANRHQMFGNNSERVRVPDRTGTDVEMNNADDASDREILATFCNFIKNIRDGNGRVTIRSTNVYPPYTMHRELYPSEMSLNKSEAQALINLIERRESHSAKKEDVPPAGEIIDEKKQASQLEEEAGVDRPRAFAPEHFTTTTTPSSPSISTSSTATTTTTTTTTNSARQPATPAGEEVGSGSWVRRSLTAVTSAFNPLSWWTPAASHARPAIPSFAPPATEPARRAPLQLAREAQLNTPVPANRQTRASRHSARAGQSLFKDERKRARQMAEQEYESRRAELEVREQRLQQDKLAFEARLASWQQRAEKRKRMADDVGSSSGSDNDDALLAPRRTLAGGRSTYAVSDASSGTESPLTAAPHATPARGQDESATPRGSILKKRGADADPAAKRQRTGLSVAFKAILEEESPVIKHQPAKRFVPVTPYRRGSLWETPRTALRSAQQPGASRSILGSSGRSSIAARAGSVRTRSANTLSVPEDDSSSEEGGSGDEMPETPSKKPAAANELESAGSTPFARRPPAAPQPAHASLPVAPVVSAPAPALAVPATPAAANVFASSPAAVSPSLNDAVSKARERATQFTPKQPSRLRESESHGPPLSTPADGASEFRWAGALRQLGVTEEVMAVAEATEIPASVLNDLALPNMHAFLRDLGADMEGVEAVYRLFDEDKALAEQAVKDVRKLMSG